MEEIKIRSSQAYKIVTEPKLKTDKEAGNLSETAKTYIEELFLYNNFKYKEEVLTDEIYKGRLVENESIGLVQSVLGGEFRIKNTKNYENSFLTGTPDIVLANEGVIEDVKSSSTKKTFFNAELTNNYFYQAQSYMALLGLKKYRLIYCLVETPDFLIEEEKKRYYFRFNCDENNPDYIKICEQIDRNHDLSMIPKEKRIKVFSFEYNQEKIDLLYKKIEKAREYYNQLTF